MRPAFLLFAVVGASFSLLHAKPATVTVAKGYHRPVWVGAPKGDSKHLWIMEQEGKVWKIDLKTGARPEKPFLDISERVSRKENEEGLLGLAFAPDFMKTGRFYINYTDKHRTSRIERLFAVRPNFDTADDSKTESLFEFKQPYWNHDGGWMDFGPDGFLYIGTGDGGSAYDPHSNGQNLKTLLGKILRVDVSAETGYTSPKDNPFVGKEGRAEIWAYGLRNPWRCSFDRKTGDLWIGDVGQDLWEEIDFLPAGHAPGANFGWRLREGLIATPRVGGERPAGAIDPVYVYHHGSKPNQGDSVTGGYVYRGSVKELQGRYIFADFQNRRVWSFLLKNGKVTDFTDHTDAFSPESGKMGFVSSFGEDAAGELYIVCLDGYVLKIIDR